MVEVGCNQCCCIRTRCKDGTRVLSVPLIEKYLRLMAEFQANSDVGVAVTIEIPNNNSPDLLASIQKNCRIECSISITVVNDDSSINQGR